MPTPLALWSAAIARDTSRSVHDDSADLRHGCWAAEALRQVARPCRPHKNPMHRRCVGVPRKTGSKRSENHYGAQQSRSATKQNPATNADSFPRGEFGRHRQRRYFIPRPPVGMAPERRLFRRRCRVRPAPLALRRPTEHVPNRADMGRCRPSEASNSVPGCADGLPRKSYLPGIVLCRAEVLPGHSSWNRMDRRCGHSSGQKQ